MFVVYDLWKSVEVYYAFKLKVLTEKIELCTFLGELNVLNVTFNIIKYL